MCKAWCKELVTRRPASDAASVRAWVVTRGDKAKAWFGGNRLQETSCGQTCAKTVLADPWNSQPRLGLACKMLSSKPVCLAHDGVCGPGQSIPSSRAVVGRGQVAAATLAPSGLGLFAEACQALRMRNMMRGDQVPGPPCRLENLYREEVPCGDSGHSGTWNSFAGMVAIGLKGSRARG